MFDEHLISFKDVAGVTTAVECTVSLPVKSIIELAMVKIELVGGAFRWRDLGKQYDTYRTEVKNLIASPEQSQTIEEKIKTPESFYFLDFSGFHPFSPLLDYSSASSGLRLVNQSFSMSSYLDDRGEANRYGFTGVAGYKDIYSFFPAIDGTITPCQLSKSSWILGGVNMPYPESKFSPKMSQPQSGVPLHGNYSVVDRLPFDFEEITTFKVILDLQGMRKLLYQLVIVSRGEEIAATIPANHTPFGQQYKDDINFTVLLADEKLEVQQINGERFSLSMKLQLKGVE